MALAPKTIIALCRFFEDKSAQVLVARKELAEGEYVVKERLEIEGVLKVGPAYACTPTPKLSGLQILTLMTAHLVNEGTLSKQAALALADRVMETALTMPSSEEELGKSKDPLDIEIVKSKASIQKRIAAKLGKAPRFGQTNFSGIVLDLADTE